MVQDTLVIQAPIGRDAADPPLRAVRPDGAPACTRCVVLERLDTATLVELWLETGRTHQARVHLAHAGHPVLGDRWYGREGLDQIARQALHAAGIVFTHPRTRREVRIESPLPSDMEALLASLRGGGAGPANG